MFLRALGCCTYHTWGHEGACFFPSYVCDKFGQFDSADQVLLGRVLQFAGLVSRAFVVAADKERVYLLHRLPGQAG